MSKFGLYGKIIAQPGQHEALVELLLAAAAALEELAGCELYIINVSPTEPDVIWVTEVWESREHHTASLQLDTVKQIIQRGRPLIAGGDRIELTPVGGKGLSL